MIERMIELCFFIRWLKVMWKVWKDDYKDRSFNNEKSFQDYLKVLDMLRREYYLFKKTDIFSLLLEQLKTERDRASYYMNGYKTASDYQREYAQQLMEKEKQHGLELIHLRNIIAAKDLIIAEQERKLK